ncbi:hypothetical protein ACPJXG_09120 [Janthinobacterium sp. NFX145]|uniref:hypothetical protein n=1 Tax=Janthinobacterium sp. NFX145 TaxID=3415602 RepID=UPI003CC641A0
MMDKSLKQCDECANHFVFLATPRTKYSNAKLIGRAFSRIEAMRRPSAARMDSRILLLQNAGQKNLDGWQYGPHSAPNAHAIRGHHGREHRMQHDGGSDTRAERGHCSMATYTG